MYSYLERKNRLAVISERIGFALSQIQTLERCSVQYLFLVTQARIGMGDKDANEILNKLYQKPFGPTINEIKKTGFLSPDLELRFEAFRVERNWLVHESRMQSDNAIHDDNLTEKFIHRIKTITDESKALLNEICELSQKFIKKQGIPQQKIDQKVTEEINRLLKQWHD